MTALGLPYPTIIGTVAGGEWASTVLDRVVAQGRYGVRLGQTWRDAEAELRACIAAAAAAANAVLGRDPALRAEPYGADMRLLVNEGRTPTVIFGPGDVRSAHSADEHVALAEVVDCARVLATWIVRELG